VLEKKQQDTRERTVFGSKPKSKMGEEDSQPQLLPSWMTTLLPPHLQQQPNPEITMTLADYHTRARRDFFRDKLSERDFFRVCSLVFWVQLLESQDGRAKDLCNCVHNCLQKSNDTVVHNKTNDTNDDDADDDDTDDDKSSIASWILPQLEPTDLLWVEGVQLDTPDTLEETARIVPQLVHVMERLFEESNSSAQARRPTKRARRNNSHSNAHPQDYKLALSYLLATLAHTYCGLDLLDTLLYQTNQWRKLWRVLTQLDTDAGVALLGLELMHSSSSSSSNNSSKPFLKDLDAPTLASLLSESR
jgi:hypothetical protein